MDITKDITFAYTAMIGYRPNTLTIIVIGHFLVEYLMNKIIFAKCKNAKKISSYAFSTKLEFLNSVNLLPDYLYKNIKTLNCARNEIVHTLSSEIKSKDFYKSSGQKIVVKVPKSRDPEKSYLKMLSLGVLTHLRNFMLIELKISPAYRF